MSETRHFWVKTKRGAPVFDGRTSLSTHPGILGPDRLYDDLPVETDADVVDQSRHQPQHDRQPEPAGVTRAVRQPTQAVGRRGAAKLLQRGAQAGRLLLLLVRGALVCRLMLLLDRGAQAGRQPALLAGGAHLAERMRDTIF